MTNLSLNSFASVYLDRLYTPGIPEEDQSTGWKQLRKMVENKMEPTAENLRLFHPLLRPYLKEHWPVILTLQIEKENE